MAKLTAVDSLRESIRLLEIKQGEEEKILKEQLLITYESLKPVNLFKNTIKEISGSFEIKRGLLEIIVSIFSAYFTQKMIVRPGKSVFKKVFVTILQLGVSSLVAKNADLIRNFMNQQFDKVRQLMEEKISSKPEDGQQVAPAE